MKFRLRDFRPSDFETLWKIDQQCFVPGISYSRAELRFYMRRPGAFTLVAEKSQPELAAETVGFVVAEINRNQAGHVITIDVVSRERRSGVGSLLLNGAEERLRSMNCNAVMLEAAVDNASALGFYKKHGYFVVKTEPRYYSNGVDAFVLRKDLQRQ